jgi:hypothetical protein
MARSPAYLVQVLVPKARGDGSPVTRKWFEGLLKELTERFGGATSFIRAPGQGCGMTDKTSKKMTSP